MKKTITSILAVFMAFILFVQPVSAVAAIGKASESVFTPELTEELSKSVHSSHYDVFILLKQVTEKEKKEFALSKEELKAGKTWYSAVEDFENLTRDVSQSEAQARIKAIRQHYYAYYQDKIANIMDDYDITEKQIISEKDILSFYNLSAEQLKKMQYDSRIDMISLYDPSIKPNIYVIESDQIVRSDDVRGIGYTGEGISIGVVDYSRTINGQPGVNYSVEREFVHPVIYVGEPSSDLEPDDTDPETNEVLLQHAAMVVGVLRHVSPSADIYLARAHYISQYQSAISYLVNTYSTDVVSISMGFFYLLRDDDALRSAIISFFNSLVCDANATICVATGNITLWSLNIHPSDYSYTIDGVAMAENILSVGGVSSGDYTSPSNSHFFGMYHHYSPDVPYPYSQPTGVVNKPDIVAPATSYNVYGFTNLSGTSFSAPLVAGSVALLMNESPYLIGRQSMVKAILAAGARYKAEPEFYLTTNNMCYSDKEGTGVLNTYASYTVRVGGRYVMQTVYSDSEGQTYSQNINVTSSDAVIRVALSWLKKTNMSNFDLRVYKGSTLIAEHKKTSTMPYENLRVIEFAPADYGYGTYTIVVEYENLMNSTDTFSLAWY